jgi:hypothetical protein
VRLSLAPASEQAVTCWMKIADGKQTVRSWYDAKKSFGSRHLRERADEIFALSKMN